VVSRNLNRDVSPTKEKAGLAAGLSKLDGRGGLGMGTARPCATTGDGEEGSNKKSIFIRGDAFF
ncbi:hypothetical protein, partial [Allomesorhizobium camelthorni]|uniref:hypothetical protein n=1 Tax=Allomesorhizobium camelthorni TaxID=475069 RepID=UPI001981D668